MLGRVGMSGITTAPHLHFQIDTADAPFHPYWPFSSREASDKKMNVFQAVSAGLGSENAAKYTIHPMAYVQHYLDGNTSEQFIKSAPVTIPQKSLEELVQFTDIAHDGAFGEAPLYSAPPAPSATKPLEEIVKFEATKNILPPSTFQHCQKQNHFENSDFGSKASVLQSKKCLFDHLENIDADHNVTRSQAVIAMMKAFDESPLSGTSHFLDIAITDTLLQ